MNEQCLFVIDTDCYAGNFELAMCEYVTGQGESTWASKAKDEIPEVISSIEDIIGLSSSGRNSEMMPNPRYGNDGMGNEELLTKENKAKFTHPAYYSVAIVFNKKPSDEIIEVMKKRAYSFAEIKRNEKALIYQLDINIEGFKLLERDYKEIK